MAGWFAVNPEPCTLERLNDIYLSTVPSDLLFLALRVIHKPLQMANGCRSDFFKEFLHLFNDRDFCI
jgi:hypothetical protein